MKILTWNVLHRVHGERHSEPALRRWPDEQERARAIAALISSAAADVVLLQEVSGDQLAALRARMSGREVLHHRYPRVPKTLSASLKDPSEHLVVIAPPGSKIVRAVTFPTDPGKGFLEVELPEGARVISTHVSWGANGAPQLEALAAALEEAPGACCLGGDFNAEREVIRQAFGAGVVVGELPPGSPRTRPKDDDGADIDHLLCRGASLREVRVLEHQALSDHRPVAAAIS